MIAVPLWLAIAIVVLFALVSGIAAAALVFWWRAVDDIRWLRIELMRVRGADARKPERFRP